MSAQDTRPISELFADALSQFSKLMRNEIRLARAEMSMKVSQTMTSVAFLTGAAGLLIPTLVLLLMAFAAWLVEIGTRPSIAHLIAGAIGLLLVAILGGIGLNRLKANSLLPERTMDQLQQDAAAVREHV
jgi:uncharacterized membrane protein YqjE